MIEYSLINLLIISNYCYYYWHIVIVLKLNNIHSLKDNFLREIYLAWGMVS